MSGRRKSPARRPVPDPGQLQELADQFVARYARLDKHGKVVTCLASAAEHANPETLWRRQGNDGKPILRDQQAGEECARQLSVLWGRPLYAYRCPRSTAGHYHVAEGSGGRRR